MNETSPVPDPEFEPDFPSAEAAADYWAKLEAYLAQLPIAPESPVDEPEPLF